ncbi:unnamed protein product [Scytosiphon promiscuus]
MAGGSTMASFALVLGLACLRQSSAFVAPIQSTAPKAHGPGGNMNRMLHRIPPCGGRSGGVNELSMSKEAAPLDEPKSSDDARIDIRGASTRLEFGAGLGAAAAAAVVLGGRIGSALAEESATAGAAAPAIVPAAAEEAAPAAAAVAAAPPAETRPLRDLGFEVPYTGKSVPLTKFLGSRATLVVNPKLDDPEALHQMPGITKMASEYSKDGLNVLLFPTDQGTFEADEDRVVRIKFYQFYGFGQFPKAVVFDKIDIVGSTIHPFYRYLCRALKNPNGIARITLNFEKFLLDKDGKVVRRYPRKLEAADFEADVKAVLAGEPLPPENRDYKLSWLKAEQEAIKSEYAFKLGLNYYNN